MVFGKHADPVINRSDVVLGDDAGDHGIPTDAHRPEEREGGQ